MYALSKEYAALNLALKNCISAVMYGLDLLDIVNEGTESMEPRSWSIFIILGSIPLSVNRSLIIPDSRPTCGAPPKNKKPLEGPSPSPLWTQPQCFCFAFSRTSASNLQNAVNATILQHFMRETPPLKRAIALNETRTHPHPPKPA